MEILTFANLFKGIDHATLILTCSESRCSVIDGQEVIAAFNKNRGNGKQNTIGV